MSTNTALDQIKKRVEKFADLCPDYMAQGIRHLERNCDLICHAEMQNPDHDCKRPDRYDGEDMAKGLAAAPKLLAALEAVQAKHSLRFYDKWGRDHAEPQGLGGWCATCQRFDGYYCPTIAAIEEALR